jgi:quercetin dioxygenase-like cupin family protein
MRRRHLIAVIAATALVAGGAATVIAQSGGDTEVTRDPLAQSTKVRGADNRTLGLSRVTIPAGGKIPLHRHQGTQIAFIQKGVLTYFVLEGGVEVRTGPADDAMLVRKIGPNQTGRIEAGDWIVEQPSTIHRAANKGKAKVVIYLSTLLKTGAPPSTPIE